MVYLLLADGFEEAEALVTADLLRRGGIPTTLLGLEERTVTGAHAIAVLADTVLGETDLSDMELLVLPGGLGGVERIAASGAARALIESAAKAGIRLAAICAAPTILAQLGLLEGRAAVCYPGMEDQMCTARVQYGKRVAEDGTIITGEAAGSVFEFGLKLVEALRGKAAADGVKDSVHYRSGT